MPRRTKVDTEGAFEIWPLSINFTGKQLYCGECGEPQSKTPGGASCQNGHGGADSVLEAEAKAIREMRTKLPAEEKKLKELSKDLKEELDKGEDLDPTDWHGMRKRMRDVSYPDGYKRIVETIIVDDPDWIYKRLHAALTIGADRTDYGMVVKHLDEAEGHYRDALGLAVTADYVYREWELDNEIVFAAAAKEATRQLQHEKNAGSRSKMITDADVQARMALLFPDEWREQERKRARMKAMRDTMRNLADVWASRCRSLQTIASKLR